MQLVADRRIVAAGLVLTASIAVGAVSLFQVRHGEVVAISLLQGIPFAIAAWLMWRFARRGVTDGREVRQTLAFIVGCAVLMRAMLILAPPHSTDIYRYIWDGRVQALGTNPYIYIPADPALAPLRDPVEIYPKINRKEYAPTIYPPMAQAVFFLASRLAETVTVMKLALTAFDLLTLWAIIALLKARGLSPVLAGIYAWHPLPIWEVAGSGHVDIVPVAFMMLAFLAAERGQRFASGAALAAGVMAKYFPLALVPAIYRRWDWRMPAAFIATAILIWLPYSGAGTKIFGFLGGYAGEQFGGGEGFYLAALLKSAGFGTLAMPVFLTVTALALFALAWRTGFRSDPDKPDLKGALAIATAVMVLMSPHYAWYFIWVIPLLCFHLYPPALWLTLASPMLYRVGWPPSLFGASLLFVPFAALAAFDLFIRLNPKETPDGQRRFA
jgi:hypothetical protein